MTSRDQINHALQQEIVSSTAAQIKFEGAMKQFSAACMQGDTVAADKLRLEVHSLLDVILDSAGVQMMLTRQLIGTPK